MFLRDRLPESRDLLAAMTIPARPQLTGQEFLKTSQAILQGFEQMFEAD
jgi:hypothetical protein